MSPTLLEITRPPSGLYSLFPTPCALLLRPRYPTPDTRDPIPQNIPVICHLSSAFALAHNYLLSAHNDSWSTSMRTVRNITVCVSPEIYRQTRLLAAKYDTTVTGVVAFLLEWLPDALERARYPVGGTKRKSSSSMPTVGGISSASTPTVARKSS